MAARRPPVARLPPRAPGRSLPGGGGGGSASHQRDEYDGFGGQDDDYSIPTGGDDYDGEGAEEGVASSSSSSASSSSSSSAAEVEVQRISLTKTTKKLKMSAEPQRVTASGSQFDNGLFKPVLGDSMDFSMGLSDIGGGGNEESGLKSFSSSGSGSSSGGNVSGGGAGALDPRSWLRKSVPPEGSSAEGEEYVEMFWFDAAEMNGIVYLFGKIPVTEPNSPKRFVSCCVAVHGSERNLFVLPRATGEGMRADGTPVRANLTQVYNELKKTLIPEYISESKGQSFKCKPVKRSYAFEHGEVPREEMEYLKVVYSAKHRAPLAKHCTGGQHIERIFGAGSSILELFILKRKLMGRDLRGWKK